MMKKTYLFNFIFLLFYFSSNTFSQSKAIDSLKQQLEIHIKQDTNRVKLLNNLAFSYYRKDINKSTAYLKEAEAISEQINFRKGKAKTLYIKGIVQFVQSNLEKSIAYFNQARKTYEVAGSKKGIAECFNGLGIVYNYNGKPQKAIECYKKSLVINEEINDIDNISSSLSNLGSVYHDIGDYKQAMLYYEKALVINKKTMMNKAKLVVIIK